MSCQFNHYRYLLDGKKTDTSDGIIKKYFLCHINDRLYYHVILKKTTAMFTREIRLGKIIVIPKFLVVSLLQKKRKKEKKEILVVKFIILSSPSLLLSILTFPKRFPAKSTDLTLPNGPWFCFCFLSVSISFLI